MSPRPKPDLHLLKGQGLAGLRQAKSAQISFLSCLLDGGEYVSENQRRPGEAAEPWITQREVMAEKSLN